MNETPDTSFVTTVGQLQFLMRVHHRTTLPTTPVVFTVRRDEIDVKWENDGVVVSTSLVRSDPR